MPGLPNTEAPNDEDAYRSISHLLKDASPFKKFTVGDLEYIPIDMYINVHINNRSYTYAYVHINPCICMYVCMYGCMYVWMDGWMDGCTHSYIVTCMNEDICKETYTN